MKDKYLIAIQNDYVNDINEIDEWEFRHRDSKVFSFYEKVLYYAFYTKPNDKREHYEGSVNTDIYPLLHKVCGSHDCLKSFTMNFQSFLSNCILDDSYFKIAWSKIWVSPKDRFDFDVSKRVPCDKYDKDSEPEVTCTHDEDEEGSQDIELLEEAFEIIIKRAKDMYENLAHMTE